MHLVSDIWARVRIARNNPETSPLNGALNEPFGQEEFSFTIVSAEIMTRDAERSDDSERLLDSPDSQRFSALDVHLHKIDASYTLPLDRLVQTEAWDPERVLRVNGYYTVRLPSLQVFDGHAPSAIDDREVGRGHIAEMV
jgi:hypothetical protein